MRNMLLTLIIVFCCKSALAQQAGASEMLGLRTTVYTVEDMVQAKQWYTKAFGVTPYYDTPYYAGFNIRGFELGLMPSDSRDKSTNVIAYWGVKNIEETLQRLLKLGATLKSPVTDVGGGIKLAVILDPFDNPVGIIDNPLFEGKSNK